MLGLRLNQLLIRSNSVMPPFLPGVSVLWDGDSFLQVKVPPSYKGKMCGLCGNYNGNKTDDFTTRRGRHVRLTRRFARSWLVGGESAATSSIC